MSANLSSHTEESRLLTDKTVLECSPDTYFVTHSDKKSSQPVETSSCLNVMKDDHQIDTFKVDFFIFHTNAFIACLRDFGYVLHSYHCDVCATIQKFSQLLSEFDDKPAIWASV
jgi:hypothetical protein